MTIRVIHGDCLIELPKLTASGEQFHACVVDPPYLLEFMGKSWDKPEAAPTGLTPFEAWFAGFVAGEGYFRIQRHRNGKYYSCSFGIHLRADDASVLKGIQSRLGGRLVFGGEKVSSYGVRSSPDVRYVVDTRDGCWAVARILDRMPLFAKKAKDYMLWRRALQIWTDTPKGNRWHGPREITEIASLMEMLQTARRFDDDAADLNIDPFMPPSQAFHYAWARAVYDALRPGAYLLAFSGTRTYHRMACAIEDAGFEIRDQFAWCYGQGFPKSKDASKAIDKELGADREVVGIGRGKGGQNLNQVARPTGSDADDARGIGAYGIGATQIDVDIPITKAATPEAAAWEGFGTAVKPAWEPLVLARKPMIGSLAKNLLKHGCGALNIDGCRVETSQADQDYISERISGFNNTRSIGGNGILGGGEIMDRSGYDPTKGRWPANLAHDGSDEVLAAFPDSKSTAQPRNNTVDNPVSDSAPGASMLGRKRAIVTFGHDDSGSAARFFFSPKADRADRADSRHPTVKPVDLIRHYARMITPPGGTLLDCFAGSGTTGEAAMLEGFDCILIERDEQSVKDIQHRIKRWSGGDAPLFAELDATPPEPDLFDGS